MLRRVDGGQHRVETDSKTVCSSPRRAPTRNAKAANQSDSELAIVFDISHEQIYSDLAVDRLANLLGPDLEIILGTPSLPPK